MALINMTQLCKQLGKSAPTIRNYIAKGLPVVTEGSRATGQEWVFDSDDCQEWFDNYQDALLAAAEERANTTEEEDEDNASLTAAKLEKIKVETARLELRLAKEQGEVVPITSVAAIVERQYTAVRAQLLALPSKLAPLLAGKSDVQEIDGLLKSYLYEALNELQEDQLTHLQSVNNESEEITDGSAEATASQSLEGTAPPS